MRVGIVGAGLSGSILYKLLSDSGFCVDVYDHVLVRGCKSVNFVFSNKNDMILVKKVLKMININIKDYIVREVKEINLCGNDYKLRKKAYVMNKSKLIEDLAPRTAIINREFNPVLKRYNIKVIETGSVVKEFGVDAETKFYDLIVDASGNAKVFQFNNKNKSNNDIKTYQFLVSCKTTREDLDKFFIDEIKIHKGKPMIGYTWINPLDDDVYHVGCAYYKNDHDLWTHLTRYLKKTFDNKFTKICGCASKINGNLICESFIGGSYEKRSVIGVGESIGLTTPIGHGNTYAIISAYILSKFIKKYDLTDAVIKYKEYIPKRFIDLDKNKKAVKNFNLLKIGRLLKDYYNIPTHDSIKVIFKSLY